MEYLIQPWQHQLDAIERAKSLPNFALFFEMGTGKTSTTINILRHKMNSAQKRLKTLILCPPIVIQNWKEEFAKHSKIPPGEIVLLTGSAVKRLKRFQEVTKNGACPIIVTNYEALLMDDLYAAFDAWDMDCLILDESHKCKDGSARRTKRAVALALPKWTKRGLPIRPEPRFKYILSGSPVLNTPLDLFSQFLILDGGQTFGKNFFAFRATYFRDKNAGMPRGKYFPKWELAPGAFELLNKKIFDHGMRVEKKDCLDLPPLVQKSIYVGMLPEQAKMYEQMKKDFLTFIDSAEGQKPVAATLAITKALRLMQITSGFAKTVEGEDISLAKTPKEAALEELLGELCPRKKVIIWAVWRENYEHIRRVCERLGLNYVEVHGETPATERFKRVQAFNEDPSVHVFLGHPGSGGIGINLTVADTCIFYSRNFSLEHTLQAEARNHRGGSEIHEKITRIDLVCQGTIDELCEKALAKKLAISDNILKGEFVREMRKQTNEGKK